MYSLPWTIGCSCLVHLLSASQIDHHFWTLTVWLLWLFNGDCVNMLTFNDSVTVLTSESFFLKFLSCCFFSFDGYYSTYNGTFLTWLLFICYRTFLFSFMSASLFLFRVVAAWMIDWFSFLSTRDSGLSAL